jgi:hypothetical protein
MVIITKILNMIENNENSNETCVFEQNTVTRLCAGWEKI